MGGCTNTYLSPQPSSPWKLTNMWWGHSSCLIRCRAFLHMFLPASSLLTQLLKLQQRLLCRYLPLLQFEATQGSSAPTECTRGNVTPGVQSVSLSFHSPFSVPLCEHPGIPVCAGISVLPLPGIGQLLSQLKMWAGGTEERRGQRVFCYFSFQSETLPTSRSPN